MAFCPECGTRNQDESRFCGACGTNLKSGGGSTGSMTSGNSRYSSTPSYKPTPQYQNPQGYSSNPSYNNSNQYSNQGQYTNQNQYGRNLPPTERLKWTLRIMWLGLIILILVALLFLLVLFPVGIVFLVFVGIQYWFIKGIENYNNTARVIYLVLTGLGIIGTIFDILGGESISILGFLMSIFVFHTLAFHQETVQRFQ